MLKYWIHTQISDFVSQSKIVENSEDQNFMVQEKDNMLTKAEETDSNHAGQVYNNQYLLAKKSPEER